MVADIFGLSGLAILMLALGLPVWAIVDASRNSALAFSAAGSNKTAWMIALVVGTFIGVGFFHAAFYLLIVRRKVRRHSYRTEQFPTVE